MMIREQKILIRSLVVLLLAIISYFVCINSVTILLRLHGIRGDVIFIQELTNTFPENKDLNERYKVVVVASSDEETVYLVKMRYKPLTGWNYDFFVQETNVKSEPIITLLNLFINPVPNHESVETHSFAVISEDGYVPIDEKEIPDNVSIAQIYRNGYVILHATIYDNKNLSVLRKLLE